MHHSLEPPIIRRITCQGCIVIVSLEYLLFLAYLLVDLALSELERKTEVTKRNPSRSKAKVNLE